MILVKTCNCTIRVIYIGQLLLVLQVEPLWTSLTTMPPLTIQSYMLQITLLWVNQWTINLTIILVGSYWLIRLHSKVVYFVFCCERKIKKSFDTVKDCGGLGQKRQKITTYRINCEWVIELVNYTSFLTKNISSLPFTQSCKFLIPGQIRKFHF